MVIMREPEYRHYSVTILFRVCTLFGQVHVLFLFNIMIQLKLGSNST
jgi:hypothetical protein